MNKEIIRLFIIYMLVVSGLAGNLYIQYYQNIATINIVEEDAEQQKKDTEKKETKEYVKDDVKLQFLSSDVKKIQFLYLANWNSLIIDIFSPPPEHIYSHPFI